MASLIDGYTQSFKLVLLFFRILGTFVPTKSNSGTREKNNKIQFPMWSCHCVSKHFFFISPIKAMAFSNIQVWIPSTWFLDFQNLPCKTIRRVQHGSNFMVSIYFFPGHLFLALFFPNISYRFSLWFSKSRWHIFVLPDIHLVVGSDISGRSNHRV